MRKLLFWLQYRVINSIGRILAPWRYTPLYRTDTNIQIGWHRFSDEELCEQYDSAIQKFLNRQ